MNRVTVYSLRNCPYCVHAKGLLNRHGIAFDEVLAEDLSQDEMARVLKESQMRTFPQIFIDGQIIGGYSELKALDEKTGLKRFLEETGAVK